MNKEKIMNCDIPEEIKDICRSCESNIFAQNKGCAFRSLGNEYCDYVENATRLYLKLQQENQQLKKQKDDVVENAKEKIKRYESYIHDLKNGNYPSPTVRQERQELIFRIREQEDLLRMLGEIDE